MWLMRVKESTRFQVAVWATAPRMPMTMEASAASISRSPKAVAGEEQGLGAQHRVHADNPVSGPAKTAVTGAGAVG